MEGINQKDNSLANVNPIDVSRFKQLLRAQLGPNSPLNRSEKPVYASFLETHGSFSAE